MKRLVILLSFVTFACSEDDSKSADPCTDVYVPGILVTVKDADTFEVLTENITVKATDGNYGENLELLDGTTPVFAGAYERAGNYTITVSKEGYYSYETPQIEVKADECHVITEEMTIGIHQNNK